VGVEPNDTFVEQLVSSAEAAVNAVVERGVVDPEKIAVGGHSYGGFMTAHLLAHTKLFKAGLARSGAYNRTLTPFGFQGEERTFWEATPTYIRLSPFAHAKKIAENKRPLLLIHGENDENSGTHPMQSERLYNAVKGMGGIIRLVKLPFERHGYRARQSIMHALYEQDMWLQTYVESGWTPPETEQEKKARVGGGSSGDGEKDGQEEANLTTKVTMFMVIVGMYALKFGLGKSTV